MKNAMQLAVLVAAAGLAVSANAQSPTLINVSGATLLENFLKAPAATNDYIDVDGDNVCGSCSPRAVESLNPTKSTTSYTSNDKWTIAYRLSGSVVGYTELVQHGQGCPTSPGVYPGLFVTGDAASVSGSNVVLGTGTTGAILEALASKLYHNGTIVYDFSGTSPVTGPLYTPANPGSSPVGANLSTLVTVAGNPALGAGWRCDLAPVDVPSTWVLQNGLTANASYTLTPATNGYGKNPRQAVDRAGVSTGYNNLLVDIGARNINTAAPDCNTIFDTNVAFVPIATITNYGTGVSQMDQNEIQHLFITGRMPTGENLTAVTREVGSGTRNGFCNANGFDPTWGVGENVGGASGQIPSSGNENLLGSSFRPSNKNGSGDEETVLRNCRLGIGYSGAERLSSSTVLRYDHVAVKCNLAGGTTYVRPTFDSYTNNVPGVNAGIYSIGGLEIFATVGDPRSSSNAIGGNTLGTDAGNTHPGLANKQAAAFINNITRSIAEFNSVPGDVSNIGMPGELAATLVIPIPARQYRNSLTNPSTLEVNPEYNATLQSAIVSGNFAQIGKAPQTSAFGATTLDGQSPARVTGVTYSDGVVGGGNYIKQSGASLGYNATLPTRNRIAGDFNGDGKRDLNDITEMMKAYWSRNSGPAWVAPNGTGAIAGAPGSDACIEILGDFDGDGSFTAIDVRYFADGLAIDPATGKLDRKKGFEAVDNAWFSLTGNNNFFGTTVPSGVTYAAGMSRFDIVGSGGIAPGWAPVGANNAIDAADRAYIAAQVAAVPGGADWSSIAQAVKVDLSADVTGDLRVDQADLDAYDALFSTACYANCDGSTGSPALSAADFTCFLTKFRAGDAYANCDGSTGSPSLTAADFTCFLTKFRAGCP